MKKRLLFILCVFFFWIMVFVIQKPLFLLYHHELAGRHSLYELFQVVLYGLRLDATMAGYLTAIPLLVTIASIWIRGSGLHTVLKLYFAITGILTTLVFTVDEALYSYWKFRLDSTVFFYLESPSNAMASVPVSTFITQFVVTILFAVLIYAISKRYIIPLLPSGTERKKAGTLFLCILAGGLLFVTIRGGVTTSTANVGMVYFSKDRFLNHAAINPCFSLLISFSKQQDFSSQFQFYPEEKRAALFNGMFPAKETHHESQERVSLLRTDKPDILFIIMEGITANVVEATGGESDITPNLNRLSKEGILFRNMYSSSFRTDRGLVAALNGYLAQPTTSIMKYPVKSQTLPSFARSLREEGYSTDVLYGGDINFTNMRSFFFNAGYNNLVADVDFPLSSRLNKWGANDDITFERLYKDITQHKKQSPWLSTFLTLSSHEPFEVPYHRLEHPYLNSVAFTDSCIGHFTDRIKQTPAWDNLLVIFVSDHGFRYPESLEEYAPGRFHIPCLWIGGAVKEAMVVDKITSQTDLPATLMAQLGLKHDEFGFSRDIFAPDYPVSAFYSFNNGFGVIDKTGVSVYDNTGNAPLLEFPSEGSTERIEKGKAILQTLYQDLGKR